MMDDLLMGFILGVVLWFVVHFIKAIWEVM